MGTSFAHPDRIIAQLDLSEGMHVADFGAGAGYLAIAAADTVGTNGLVYVIDIQQALLTKLTHLAAKHHAERFCYIHGDLETPHGSTLQDDSIDWVLVSNLLFQTEQKDSILREAFRVLRPGGMLLIVDWKESYGGMGPQSEHVLHEESARELARTAGFHQVKDIDAGLYHYGIVFKK